MKSRTGILFALGIIGTCTYSTASSAEEKANTARETPARALWASVDLPLLKARFGPETSVVYSIQNSFALRFGGQLSDHWLVGVNVELLGFKDSAALLAAHDEHIGLRLEYLQGNGKVRPFIALTPQASLWAAATPTHAENWSLSLGVSLSSGAHIFVARSISIDPYAEVGYTQSVLQPIYLNAGFMLSAWYWR